MFKNTASQMWTVLAFYDGGGATAGARVLTDQANITAKISIDGAALSAIADTNPTVVEDGKYRFNLTTAETNGDKLEIFAESATGNVLVIGLPEVIYTRPPNFPDLGIGATGDITTVATATNLTNLPAITANWLTAAGLAADAVTEIQSGLSTHAALDVWHVAAANVVTAGTIGLQLKTNVDAVLSARTLASAAYFDPAADVVANVTLVATTTTNTDMITAAGIRSAIGMAAADLDTQLAALPTQSEITGGVYPLSTDGTGAVRIVDGTGTGEIDTTLGVVKATLPVATQASIDAIEADTNELQGDWTNTGRLDTILDSILADTNELQVDDVPGLIAALTDIDATGIRTAIGLAAANLDTQLAALPTQAEITGGGYPLSTDGTGAVRIVDGTGVGELDTNAGLIAGIAGTKNTLDDLNDITAANVKTEVVAGLQTDTPVAGKSVADALEIIGATAAGVITNAGAATETFKDFGGATKVSVAVDGTGNRTSIVYAA